MYFSTWDDIRRKTNGTETVFATNIKLSNFISRVAIHIYHMHGIADLRAKPVCKLYSTRQQPPLK